MPPDPKKLPAWLQVRLTKEEVATAIDSSSAVHTVRALLKRHSIEIPAGQIRIEREGPRCVLLQLTEYSVRELIEVRKITVIDVTTLDDAGVVHCTAEAQIQLKTQAAWEKGESAAS